MLHRVSLFWTQYQPIDNAADQNSSHSSIDASPFAEGTNCLASVRILDRLHLSVCVIFGTTRAPRIH